MMKDLLSNESLLDVSNLLKKIALLTFAIEGTGAILLYLSLGGSLININTEYFYSSIFHSVSAFCNAGFSLYSTNLMDSSIRYNYYFPTIIMILIVFGGLGFSVLSNILKLRPKKIRKLKLRNQLNVSSKIVIITTLILIFGGGLMIYFSETYSFAKNFTFFDRIYHAIFQSVTARTAGYNTLPVDKMTQAAACFLILLMWIGASPGSTGGGIKTSTFSIAMLSLLNYIKGREKLFVFKRQIPQDTIIRAFLVIFCSLLALCISSILLIWIEPDKKALNLVFEATSALGTVGLSRNVTFFLGIGGKVIIILLMYIGRIGVLTFLIAFYKPRKEYSYTLPKEVIPVG